MRTATITLSEEAADRLRKFSHLCGFDVPAEVMNHAVDIMTWAVLETHAGNSVCSVNHKGEARPVTSPLLRAVADLPFPIGGGRPNLRVVEPE